VNGGSGTGDAANGEQVFASAGCGGCHTFEAAGSTGSVGPNLDDASPSFDTVVTMVTNGGGAMPSFEGDLSEQEINDVAAFVSGS
jgi:mono/diheme cytochrome c family protein